MTTDCSPIEDSRFVSGLIHELRQPLNTFRLVTDLLEKYGEQHEIEAELLTELAGHMEKATGRLTGVLDVFDRFTRELRLDPQPMNPMDGVQRAVERVSGPIEIEGKLGSSLVADASWFEQALVWLMEHAIESGRRCRFRLSHDDAGSRFALEFHPPEQPPPPPIDQFFEPYAAGGLELALTKKVFDHHGWDLRAESGPDDRITIAGDMS